MAQPLPNLEALSDEALNAAVAHIQKKLGVDSGDFASHFFDERNSAPIMLLLIQYARAEIAPTVASGGSNAPHAALS